MALNLGFKSKIALAVGSLGAIGGGGFMVSHILSGETIENHLKKVGFTVLEDSSPEWTSILSSYVTAIKTNSDLKFGDFDGTNNGVEKLKQNCKALLNQKHKTPEISKDYKKTVWCVKEQTVSDYLKIKGYRAFDTSKTKTDDDSKWDAKAKEHSKQNLPAEKTKIPQLAFSGNDLSTVNEADRNKIKQSCKALNEKKHYETDFKKFESLVISWCSELTKSE